MNQKGLITIVCIFFIAVQCNAQHFLDGTWTGNYTKTFLSVQPKKVVVNLQVVNDSFVVGSSHLYYNNENNFEHYTIHGFYDAKDSSIFFSEDSTIAVHLGFADDNCLGDYIMTLKTSDTMLRFSGKWKDNSSKFLGCPTTGVWLQKPLPKKPVAKKKDQNLQRIADLQKTGRIGCR